MAITISTQNHMMTPMAIAAGNVLPLFETEPKSETDMDAGRLLHLTNHLQTSLEVEEIIRRFSDEINLHIPHDYLGYTTGKYHSTKALKVKVGKNARYKLNYQLTIGSDDLGSLVVSRKRKFTAIETSDLEYLISALLYPLRNALLYRDALYAAHKDALTGISNRAALNEVLDREIDLAQRHDRSLGMIVIDIDHFKEINDTYGHATGDCLLKALAFNAEETIRLSDQIFRFGGEEFVVLLPETDIKGVKRLAERIRRNIEAMESVCEGSCIKITASLGIATLNYDENEEEFFTRADKALYKAKDEGRNCTRIAD